MQIFREIIKRKLFNKFITAIPSIYDKTHINNESIQNIRTHTPFIATLFTYCEFPNFFNLDFRMILLVFFTEFMYFIKLIV